MGVVEVGGVAVQRDREFGTAAFVQLDGSGPHLLGRPHLLRSFPFYSCIQLDSSALTRKDNEPTTTMAERRVGAGG